MRVFAILHEPAQYTTDRNHAVYDHMGVRYAYMHGQSEAKSDEGDAEKPLSELSFLSLVAWIWKQLKENDVIIMNGYTNKVFICLFVLNYLFGRTIGIDSDTPLSIPEKRIKRIIKFLFLSTIFRNRHIYGLAGGEYTHKDLFRHYGMKEGHIFLMPMMVNNEKFYVKEKVKHDIFTFLYVGRVVACKNLLVMIDAFIQQFNSNEKVQLRIVGGGELLDTFKQKYAEHQNIVFAGKHFGEDLIRQYHGANVFVLPSSFEPWGLVVNEAMSASLPVIVSNRVGAADDLVKNRDTGFVFQFDNVQDLAETMRILKDDEELYKRMSDNAYRFMHDNWNYGLYSQCLRSFLEHVENNRVC